MSWVLSILNWLWLHRDWVVLGVIILVLLRLASHFKALRWLFSLRVLSLVLALLFLILAVQTTNNAALQSFLAGVASCFIFALAGETVQFLHSRIDKRDFRDFFGEEAINNRMSLVYPDFVLAQEVQDVLRANSINPQLVFQKTASKFSATHRVDVPHTVSDNDLQALIYVAGLFGRICKDSPPVKVDFECVKAFDGSFISFGLSSNDCTHMYMESCGENLFDIVEDEAGSEFLQMIKYNEDGSIIRKDYKSDFEKYNYGLIIRFHPNPTEEPNRVWFFCAGLGPNGTTGAAWFLSNHWPRLHRLVGRKDFAAVVKVPIWSDKATKLDNEDIYYPPPCQNLSVMRPAAALLSKPTPDLPATTIPDAGDLLNHTGNGKWAEEADDRFPDS